ncbi:translesion error-prone DNA polymerase V autoproteolytic subunit [Yaniella flava]|uniref:Translesion error-prone DNA polymerase V autoproteolytic subunit n=2 Tax=Yaniella flava TaxID=287930 RepID=A0ABN2UGD1_9MICC
MKVEEVYQYAPTMQPRRLISAGVGRVPAGFPSPSQDYSDTKIDLNQMLIKDELSTFVVRVSGDSMEDAGIFDGDELIVDRSIEPHDGHVVIAVVDGEMTVKRLRVTDTGVVLQAENAQYPDVTVPELSDLVVWGVATRCLHRL